METYKIGDRVFEQRTPVPNQKIKVYELMRDKGIDFDKFSNLEDNPEYAAEIGKLLMFSDFDGQLAAIWLIEKGKTFTESHETNKNDICEWYMENGMGVSLNGFFIAMQEAITQGNPANARTR